MKTASANNDGANNKVEAGAFAALRALTAPDAAPLSADLAFDGGRMRAAADGPTLTPGPDPVPSQPALGKPGPKKRVIRRPTAYVAFANAAGYGALAGGTVLAAWGMMSWMHALPITVIAGTAAWLMIFAMERVRGAARLARRVIGREQPKPVAASTGVRWGARLAGAALGLTLAVGALHYQRPLVEGFHGAIDRVTEQAQRENVRAIPGDAFAAETTAVLSHTAMGRSVLERLEDRGGVLRLPHFYVITKPDVLAQYNSITDAVYIDANLITNLGYTVDQFLADPAIQRAVVAKTASTLLHELTHTLQGRRSPLERGYWLPVMEHEYEAFVNELWFNHERLQADPAADISPNDLYQYESSLNDLNAFLLELDRLGAYQDNVHLDNERWRAWRADLVARWPAHRAEGYELLARRAEAKGDGALAREYRHLAAGQPATGDGEAGPTGPFPHENR